MKRIVITGMGMITPLGHDVAQTWEGIKAGKSGIGLLTRFDASTLESRVAGEVKDFDPGKWLGHKEARRMDRYSQYAIVASAEALAESGHHITPENSFETGVLVGAGFGGAETLQEGVDVLQAYGPRRVKPLMFPSVLNNMGSAQVAMKFGMRGANFSVSAACATSAVAIGEAVEMVRRGEVDVMLGGGSEAAFAMFAMAGLNATRALTNRNDAPELASRPFDATRDGYVPAEGAGMLVIETLEHAQARGAKVLAEVVGYGVTCDAHHVTAPEETGAAIVHAIKKAISRAGITIYDIDYINAHGTSTPLNDLSETRAIKQVFGEQAYNIPVSSTKSMTGHAMSAAGVFEAIFSIKAMHEGVIPPTINYHNPDPACDLDYVPNVARKADKPLRYVMSNSFGFGGQNAVLIFKNPALDPTLNGANGAHS